MQCYSNNYVLLFIPFRDTFSVFSMLSLKGFMSLKIDTDYNSCLLFESTRMGPEDLKKLGNKLLFLLFPTVEGISTC